MAVYWLNFRLESDETYDDRYDALMDGIRAICSKWWIESSSFIVFEADNSIDEIAGVAKGAVNEETDIVVIGMPQVKSGRAIGAIEDHDLFKLIPFMKKV